METLKIAVLGTLFYGICILIFKPLLNFTSTKSLKESYKETYLQVFQEFQGVLLVAGVLACLAMFIFLAIFFPVIALIIVLIIMFIT